MSIEILNINKHFGKYHAIKGLNLNIQAGELVALLGPSGCGKTTLLRIIAGLESPDSGSILFSGEDTVDKHVSERNVGFVFQHYALFKHMTVFENIAFGLKIRPRNIRPSKADIKSKVEDLLKLVKLELLQERYPSQLSGGQRQRVALARALAVEPKVLLLDEPFGALDAQVRKELRRWLRKLHDEIHVTSVFVTHDQEEALEVADRVVVMNQGKIEQAGTPEEVYTNPATPFVYNFLGNVNLFHGRMENGKLFLGNKEIEHNGDDGSQNNKAFIYIRPHHFDIHLTQKSDAIASAIVEHISPAGSNIRVELIDEFQKPVLVEILMDRYKELGIKKGDKVFISPKETKVFFDASYPDYSI
ncbi:MAG: sulfate/molybdate ABC transporter ATP-binding protein [Leptospiraceae bacterium]|nr:sulfate/molybdate ABC transporter ATP-binding protein [Leptospiraceae bacterium]